MQNNFFLIQFEVNNTQKYGLLAVALRHTCGLKGGQFLTLDHMGSPVKNHNFEKRSSAC